MNQEEIVLQWLKECLTPVLIVINKVFVWVDKKINRSKHGRQ